MNFEEVINKSIALLLWNMEKEDDVHAYLGKLQMEEGKYNFINKEKGWKISLNDEQLARIRAVPEELKTVVLNADYSLNMTISLLPNSDIETSIWTGMKWHD